MNLKLLILLWAFCLSKGIVADAQSQNLAGCSLFGKGVHPVKGDVFYSHSDCPTIIAQDCSGALSTFYVERRQNSTSGTTDFLVVMDSVTIALQHDSYIIDGKKVKLPQYKRTYSVQKTDSSVIVQSRIRDFTFIHNDEGITNIKFRKTSKVCGLCEGMESVTDYNLYELERRSLVPASKDQCSPEIPFSRNTSVCETGTQVCSVITKYLGDCPENIKDGVLQACAIDVCESDGSKESACAYFSYVVHKCREGTTNFSQISYWRNDSDIACEPPVCGGNLVYNEFGSTSQPRCSLTVPPSNFQPSEFAGACSCPEGLVLNDVQGDYTCIPRSECPCKKEDNVYLPGKSITTPCKSCECIDGGWACTKKECPATCKLEHGSHVTTFDSSAYTFAADGEVIMVQSKAVLVLATISQHEMPVPEEHLDSVTIVDKRKEISYSVAADGKVLMNGNEISTPFNQGNEGTKIFAVSPKYMQLITGNVSILIQHEPKMQLFVTVQPDAQGTTAGLCGKYNNIDSDDFTSQSSIVEENSDSFVKSWLTKGRILAHGTCINKQNADYAETYCGLLMDPDGIFAPCHPREDVRQHYENCRSTTCISSQPKDSMCTSLENYARTCAAKESPVHGWRLSVPQCEWTCNNGMVFSYNMTACNQTCQSHSVPDFTCNVIATPIEGCGCPKGKFTNKFGKCVEKQECECYTDTAIVDPGEIYNYENAVGICVNAEIQWLHPPPEIQQCSNGSYYVDCKSATLISERTCSNPSEPTIQTCTPGCYCSEPLVRYNNTCIAEEDCPCVYNTESYKTGSTIQTNSQDCTCNMGKWTCTYEEHSSSCLVSRSGTFVTFDNRRYMFTGFSEYILFTDHCDKVNGSIVVTTLNVPCCENGVACSRITKITFMNKIFTIKDGLITVNFISKTCEDAEPDYEIHSVGLYTILELKDIKVTTDMRTYLRITVDPNYRGKTCGLCGNNNGNVKDDFTTSDNMQVGDVKLFAESWNTYGSQYSDMKDQGIPCTSNNYCHQWASKKCSIIKGPDFKDCHQKVNPDIFFSECIEESCTCNDALLCASVERYADACNRHNVCVEWRSINKCPPSCDMYNRKGQCTFHYEPCGSPEVKTCSGKAVKEFASNLEGCYPKCPKDAPYLDENHMKCVPLSHCSCWFHDRTVEANEVAEFNAKDCCKTCVCTNGQMNCVNTCNITSTTTMPTTIRTTATTTTSITSTITAATTTTITQLLYSTTAATTAPPPGTTAPPSPAGTTTPPLYTTAATTVIPSGTQAPSTPAGPPTTSAYATTAATTVPPPGTTAPPSPAATGTTAPYTGPPTTSAYATTAATTAPPPGTTAPPSPAATGTTAPYTGPPTTSAYATTAATTVPPPGTTAPPSPAATGTTAPYTGPPTPSAYATTGTTTPPLYTTAATSVIPSGTQAPSTPAATGTTAPYTGPHTTSAYATTASTTAPPPGTTAPPSPAGTTTPPLYTTAATTVIPSGTQAPSTPAATGTTAPYTGPPTTSAYATTGTMTPPLYTTGITTVIPSGTQTPTTAGLRVTTVHPTRRQEVTEKQVSATTSSTPPPCLCKTDPPRKPFETWTQDCGSATCTENCTIVITPNPCPEVTPCKNPVQHHDGCCLQQECYCKCSVWGEPYFTTFSGVNYNYPGNCTYVLVQEKVVRTGFQVIADNFGYSPDITGSYVKAIVASFNGTTVSVATDGGAMYVDDEPAVAPCNVNGITIHSTGAETTVYFPSIQSSITVGHSGYIAIEMPENEFRDNTEGQCGVCGGKSCIRRNGKAEPDTCCGDTANDWLINDDNKPYCTSISKPCTVPPISPPPTMSPEKCRGKCCLINDLNCPPDVDINFVKESCARDYVWKRNAALLCASLSYAAELCSSCSDWRSKTQGLCNITCPSELQYYTCKNTTEYYCDGTEKKPYENFDSNQEGCYCPEGMIRESKHSDKCVTQCAPCCGPQGEPKYPGDQWISNCFDCICSGITQKTECKLRTCPPAPTCQQNEILKTYNDSDSCCPIQTCETVTCLYKNTQYKANDIWSDGCTDCECDAASNTVMCQCRQCPSNPVCGDNEQLRIKPDPSDPCCNSAYCEKVVCRYNKATYYPGDKWTTQCGECTCDKITASVICSPKVCPNDPVCKPDQQLTKSFRNASCCPVSQCVPKTCEYQGNSYNVGQSFVDSKDNCLRVNCTINGLDFTYEKCLYLTNCPMERRIYTPRSCCYTCADQCLTTPKTVTLYNGACKADVEMNECQGVCASSNVTATNDALVNTCTCCTSADEVQRIATLTCPNGSKIKHYYKYTTSCKCSKSRS